MAPVKFMLAVLSLTAALAACGDSTNPSSTTVLDAVSPAAAATGVAVQTTVSVRFSGPMQDGMEQYVDLHHGDIAGSVVPMTCAWSDNRATLTCTPATPLESGSAYTLHLGGGMMDASHQRLNMERNGMDLGGQVVTSAMMGGTHAGAPTGMMGSGWQHMGDGHLGIAFTFTTA